MMEGPGTAGREPACRMIHLPQHAYGCPGGTNSVERDERGNVPHYVPHYEANAARPHHLLPQSQTQREPGGESGLWCYQVLNYQVSVAEKSISSCRPAQEGGLAHQDQTE